MDPPTGEIGIAVATRLFAVGARVPFAASRVGAVATQALVNPYYGIDGLLLLRKGHTPAEALSTLLEADSGREHRQVHLMGHHGDVAAHTGSACLNWAGHRWGHCFSVAGNMLVGPEVLGRTMDSFIINAHLPFAQRLISAMQAGEAAGGDIRGKQSAALLICRDDEWSSLDLRIDDHPDPLRELDRLEKVSRIEWVQYRPFVPTRANPAGVTDHDVIDAAVGSSRGEV
jgi:uncharacterized Ntn-hydrolase superfamily protein